MSRTNVQARLDLRHLAAIHRHLKNEGIHIQSRSELVHAIVKAAYDSLENTGLQPFDSFDSAVSYLTTEGLGFERGQRAHKQIVKLLQNETLRFDADDEPMSDLLEELKKLEENE